MGAFVHLQKFEGSSDAAVLTMLAAAAGGGGGAPGAGNGGDGATTSAGGADRVMSDGPGHLSGGPAARVRRDADLLPLFQA